MENQASGPLGTDVCSPLDSSQSATEAVQEPGPLATPYLQPQVIHTWIRERELCLLGETNKARKSNQSLMLTRQTCSKHTTSVKLGSLRATVTAYNWLFKPRHSFILQLSTNVLTGGFKTTYDALSRASLFLCILEDVPQSLFYCGH